MSERPFESDPQTTSRIERFDLEDILASPEVRPTDPPAGPDPHAVPVGSLPPPAIEIDQTKEEERDP